MSDTPFAYSMSHVDAGWSWSIFDEDGETVATGYDSSQSGAQAAVEATIMRVADQMRSAA